MVNKKARTLAGLVFLALLIFWSAFIFARSAKTAEESSEESAIIITLLAAIFNDEFENVTPEKKHEYIEGLQFFVRKFAHFAAYAMMGALGAASAHFFGLHKLSALVYAVIFAGSDEIHQYFVPGRSCELRDFFIDTAGALFGIMAVASLCALVKAAERYRHKKRIRRG